MKIGILGGTFNPPHNGHLILAREVKEKLKLDKILFIPTNIPPHKENNPTASVHRLAMATLAIKGQSDIEISDMEIARGGTSYTIDTINQLKLKFPQSEFFLIVGSDLAQTFSTWKDFGAIKDAVKIVVAKRDKFPLKEKSDFIIIDITQIDTSSSQIRRLAIREEAIDCFIDPEVANYIKEHNLYKGEKND